MSGQAVDAGMGPADGSRSAGPPMIELAIALALLLIVAVLALSVAGVAQRRAVVTASARAVVQLAVVALALRGAFAHPMATVLIIAVMMSVAVATAARRLRPQPGALGAVALACLSGYAVTIAIVMGVPALSRELTTLVAVSGIVLGGSMTSATLTGRRLLAGLNERRDEVEGWLAIGATPRQAVRPIARQSVYEALVPALDQTRTVGLVTLPGAFAGALVGGADVALAARFQVVVLVGLLCAESVTATVLVHRLGAPTTLPTPPRGEQATT